MIILRLSISTLSQSSSLLSSCGVAMSTVPLVAPAVMGISCDAAGPLPKVAVSGTLTASDRACERCAVIVTDSLSSTDSGAESHTTGTVGGPDRQPHSRACALGDLRGQVRHIQYHAEGLVLGVGVVDRGECARAAGVACGDLNARYWPVVGARRHVVIRGDKRNGHRVRQRLGERRRQRHAVARLYRAARRVRQVDRRGVVVVDGDGHRRGRARRDVGR